jgi:DNA (cytosine-5)-methyltransferase 1
MAGFRVIGVDIADQPNYPFEFHRADALDFDISTADVVHASPPCQGYSRMRHRQDASKWPKLIPDFREKLKSSGVPYVIENVEDAASDMEDPVTLCGSSFGLRVRRHRLFESNLGLEAPPCDHSWQELHRPYRLYVGAARTNGLGYRESGIQQVYGGNHNVGGRSHFLKSVSMGIDWMDEGELNEAIPPAYALHIGRQIMERVRRS